MTGSHDARRNPVGKEHWGRRYETGDTPWDLGRAHPELLHRIADGTLAPAVRGARAYVPGCGRGHDARALARSGWDVVAVDLVPELARWFERSGSGASFLAGDALAHEADAPFDLLFEHTFFCALPPERRGAYGEMAARLTRAGSRLAAVVFPVGRPAEMGGPPFGIDTSDVANALGSRFRLVADEPAARPVSRRSWGERFALFERTAD